MTTGYELGGSLGRPYDIGSGQPITRRYGMQLDKQFVLDELRKEGQSDQVQRALDELPAKIDHEQHADLLEKLGLDPGKLAEKAIERGIAKI
jgi:hypothetical protein